MININSNATANTLDYRITLANNGTPVASLDPQDSKVLTCTFNQVQIIRMGHPPVVRTQTPATAVTISPGKPSYFESHTSGIRLRYTMPNNTAHSVVFN